jgi:hypothetical protein
MDDMMGALGTTAFVVSGGEVLAVTLLNHHVRYRIPVGDEPQVAVSADGARLYVVDRIATELRIRWFDVLSGSAGRVTAEPIGSGGSGALKVSQAARGAAAHAAGALYLLRHADRGLLVYRHQEISLAVVDQPAKNIGCADRLLVGDTGFALVCRAEGEINLFPNGVGSGIARFPAAIAGVTMAADGSIFASPRDGGILRIKAGTRGVDALSLTSFAPVVEDGLAWTAPSTLVLAQGGARPRLHAVDTLTGRVSSFDLPNVPANGILASGQFAYWVDVDGSGLYHIDITTGLVERMYGPLGAGSSLGAVTGR